MFADNVYAAKIFKVEKSMLLGYVIQMSFSEWNSEYDEQNKASVFIIYIIKHVLNISTTKTLFL